MTMTLISTVTVGSGGAANIDFTSIPAIYTDLMVICSLRTNLNDTNEPCRLDFNNNTANQTSRLLLGAGGSGTSTFSYTYINIRSVPANTSTASTFSNTRIYIPNYTNAVSKNVSIDNTAERNNYDNFFTSLIAGSWNDTSAITSVKVSTAGGGTFVQNSTASLYGILKGSGGATVS